MARLARQMQEMAISPQKRQQQLKLSLWPSCQRFDETSAPYFTEEIRRLLIERQDQTRFGEGGLSVRPTLDPTLQESPARVTRRAGGTGQTASWRGARTAGSNC